MKTSIDWKILVNYLEGNCSNVEKNLINEWAGKSEKNKKELDLLRKIWSSPELSLPKPDVESVLQKVLLKIENIPEEKTQEHPRVIKLSGTSFTDKLFGIIFNPAVLKAAAVFILIVGFYLIYQMINVSSMNEVYVENKSIKEINLADGSLVKLDAGTYFKYPEYFNGNNREVYLNGEAYFEIKHDPGKPFIVHANYGMVKVLGTKFNVRAWDYSGNVIVTVTEGLVSLQNRELNATDSVMLINEGFESSISKNSLPAFPHRVDVNMHLSWMYREKGFISTELSEVLHQLERWYNVKISLPDESYNKQLITVFIENKKLEENIEVLSLVMDFRYEIEGRNIRFLDNQ
ncbi:FecR family protein [Bacteroidota bacterium]